jgi:prepilin-type N-terminal cleavage/methylation domain-containing protein/prepilin-type processing-associated H-X9-DG protein
VIHRLDQKRREKGIHTLAGFRTPGQPRCPFARRGFTLLELLVVVAAISIVASLSLAAFGLAVGRGRQAKCVNNLRQIGEGIINYAKEDDDLELPTIYEMNQQDDGRWKLSSRFQHSPSDILGFIDPALLVCPSDKNPAQFQATDVNEKPVTVPCSYGFNFLPALAGVRFSTLDPRTFLVFDGRLSATAQSSNWTGSASDAMRFASDLGFPRHGGKFGVYFADGHCELLRELPTGGGLSDPALQH